MWILFTLVWDAYLKMHRYNDMEVFDSFQKAQDYKKYMEGLGYPEGKYKYYIGQRVLNPEIYKEVNPERKD